MNKRMKKMIITSVATLGLSIVAPLANEKVNAATDTENLSVKNNSFYTSNALLESKLAYMGRDSLTGFGGGGSGSIRGLRGGGAAALGGVGLAMFSPHTKNARKSTHDKHTKRRPGGNEKKKQKTNWKRNR